MNKIEPGQGVPQRRNPNRKRPTVANRPSRNGQPVRSQNGKPLTKQELQERALKRRKQQQKQKTTSFLSALILAVIGVVVIALIIMTAKRLTEGSSEQSVPDSSSVNSSILAGSLDGDSDFSSDKTIYLGRPSVSTTPVPSPAAEQDISNLSVEQYGSMITVGNKGYDYYKFDLEMADKFVAYTNNSISKLPADADVYTMIVPGGIDIMLPLSFLEDYSSVTSDQEKTIKYINNKLTSGIKKLNLYGALKAHCDEKLYYYTDNKPTSLAGFYIYNEFLYAKGLEQQSILTYGTGIATNFLGNINAFLGTTEVSNPEPIEYYIPNSDLVLDTGEPIFADVSGTLQNYKYNVFLGGSRGLTHIVNKSKSNGSVAVLVGDSVSYTLAPFFAQNYEDLYFIDYREYEDTVASLATEKEADDVIYCFSIGATNTESLIESIK